MNNNSTHGLRPEQLFNLLSVGADKDLFCDNIMNSDEEVKEYFQSLIHRKVPKETSLVDSILIFLRESKAFGNSIIDHSLGEILNHSKTEIELLKTIKYYSKNIYQSTVSKGENSIAVAIYYAAIASGLVYHDMKISEHTYQTLKEAFSNLMNQPWMISDVKQLFSEAHKICENEHITQ